jgi:phosphoenolpyruvate-protein kinase (PTS system EI component)
VTETTSLSSRKYATEGRHHLSHAAIAAREYGIPAIVGTGNGSARIKDGQLVEVDGHAGIVRIILEGR